MKKFLALVLALVMTMSLVTIAGAEDYTDADSMNYAEAVEVMSAIEVVGGYADGSFNPQGGLTRGAAAKIICNMILGPTTAEALAADSAPYSDVAVDNVFAGYIAYCAKEGIISGYADGTFRPAAPLTGYAFMKMLLGALGYDAAIEGYTGSNWSINVAKRALNIGLDDGLVDTFVGTKALTREEACLYAFNALQADMVNYGSKSTITVGDVTVSTSAEASIVNDVNANKIWKNDGATQFAEKYFAKLAVKTNATDAFGRPATEWKYGKTVVGTFAEEADLVYTGAEYDSDLVADLQKDYKFAGADVWYNGKDAAGAGVSDLNKKGYTVELFINDDDEVTDIVVTEAYAVEVTDVVVDDDDEIVSVELTVYEAGYFYANEAYAVVDVDVEDDEDAYALIAEYEEDDVFVAFLMPGWADGEVEDINDALLAVEDVEVVEGKITAKSADAYYNGWIKVDGVKYEFANEYSQVAVATKDEGTFYIYEGYVVHANVDPAEITDYLFVVESADETDVWGTTTNYAKVVYADGKTETIVTKDLADEGAAYKFKYNTTKEYYELSGKVAGTTQTITKGTSKIATGLYGNANTEYVLITLDEDDAIDTVKVYNGYKKVPTVSGTTAVIAKDGTAQVAFVLDGTLDTSATDMIYVAIDSVSGETTDENIDSAFYTVNAIVDGVITTIMVDSASYDGLYKASETDADGIYKLSDAATSDDFKTAASMKAAADEVVTLGDDKVAYADDVTVYVVSAKGVITTGSIAKNYTNDIDTVLYTLNDDGEVATIYVVKA